LREVGEPRRAYWFLGALMAWRSVKWGAEGEGEEKGK